MNPWHTLSPQATIKKLRTSVKTGLTFNQVKKLEKTFGPNQIIQSHPKSWWQKLLPQLNDYLIWILLIGAVISFFVGEWLDGSLIIAIIGFMAILGYIQDNKAENSLKQLKNLETPHVRVIRQSKIITLLSTQLLPGDIVLLRAGDAIPADLRLLNATNATADEATLTGESLPTTKQLKVLPKNTPLAERSNILFSGTLFVQGYATAVVVETGMNTQLGQIAHLLSFTEREQTPLEIQLQKLGKTLGTTLILAVAFVLIINVFIHRTPLLHAIIDAVALAIAAVPEGLPAVITICLSFGVQKMVKKNALVRQLKAVEALGSVSVICTDKTGTLTEGKMSVTHTHAQNLDQLIQVADSCNNQSDPTEIALTDWIKTTASTIKPQTRLHEFEFNSSLKRMTTIHRLSSKKIIAFVKGAPEVILSLSNLTPPKQKEIKKQIKEMAGQGLRVLAFAQKNLNNFNPKTKRETIETNLDFIGLIGLSDPPKKEAVKAIQLTRQAGIKPVMVTGDNPLTAQSIAIQIGLVKNKTESYLLTGDQLETLYSQKKYAQIRQANILARVTPKHKSLLIDAYEKGNLLVAMVGDGVNDAPSIKAAHVGVAMGLRGSEVTKSASDLVLLDDNYATLIDAIKEGRYILNRIRLFVGYLLSCNLAEIGIFIVAIIINVPMPLSAIMLLLLNIVTDAAPAIAMSREPGNPAVMYQPPRGINDPIITKPMWKNIILMSIITTAVVMTAYLIGLKNSLIIGQTMAFASISFLELFRAYTARSLTHSLASIGFFKNIWTTYAVIFGSSITLVIIYFGAPIFHTTPLSLTLLITSLALALVAPLIEELSKKLAIVKKDR